MPPRRHRGEGSVYQRADGKWVGSVDLSQPGEPRRRKYVYAQTRTEAARRLAALQRDLANHGDLPTAAPTVAGWLRHWLDSIAAHELRHRTLEGTYRPKVERAIRHLGNRRLDRLRPDALRAAYVRMAQDEGLSQATILQTHRILSRAFTVAVREGVLTRNPCDLMDAPKVGKPAKKGRPLTPEQVVRLLTAIRGDRLESRWLFALTLGARQGEILGLSWEDIDWTAGTVTITRALGREKGRGLRFTEVKSEMSHRALPMPPWLIESLRRRRAAWEAETHTYDPRGRGLLAPPDLIWTSPTGGPVDPSWDWKQWSRLLERAGVPHVGTHAARHTVATLLSAQGAPPKVAQAVLGHSQVSLTLNVYTQADVEAIRPWLAGLERAYALDPAGSPPARSEG